MLETEKQLKGGGLQPLPILIAAILLAGAVYFGYSQWKAAGEAVVKGPELSDEARAYLEKLDLGGVQMAAKESQLGDTLVEITGNIGNLGERQIRSARLNCVFYDVNGIELHRVPSTIVRARDGLRPGAETSFRLAFDAIPEGWNQTMPSLYIAEIIFAD